MNAGAPVRTSRADARDRRTRAILDRARSQLADGGPEAVSLRQVARDLNLVSSAVYRYFPSRDQVLTALVVECLEECGAAVEAAEAGVARERFRERFVAAGVALREWALRNPHEYALLYGSAMPGYTAAAETGVWATRAFRVLLELLTDAGERGLPSGGPSMLVPAEQRAALAPIATSAGRPVDVERLLGTLVAWSTLTGHISLEVFGHLLGVEIHFGYVVERVAADLGLT